MDTTSANYDPQLLLGFTELHRVSLIKLSLPVVCQLKPWLSAKFDINIQSTLTSCCHCVILQIILVTRHSHRQILEAIAPSLVNQEHLNLSDCYRVTHLGVWAIVSSSANGILGLTLESVYFNFVKLCSPIYFPLISFGIWLLGHGRFCEPMHIIWCT